MKSFLTFILLFLTTLLFSQTTLTRGQIFDFNVNDEFHTRNFYPTGSPPNARRWKVTGKYFSAAKDTVFYTGFHNDYYTVYNSTPQPHLDYYFSTGIDTVFYTNLKDSVLCDPKDTFCVSVIDTTPCGTLENGWMVSGSEFYTLVIYGKGLGVVGNTHWISGSPSMCYDYRLFYYKSGNIICGSPDVTSSGSIDNFPIGNISVYPNPFNQAFTVKFPDKTHTYSITILDIKGRTLFQSNVDHVDHTVIDQIKHKGFYFLKIESAGKSYITKIIKI